MPLTMELGHALSGAVLYVGERTFSIADLATIEALDPETRAVVERYAALGGMPGVRGEQERLGDRLAEIAEQIEEAEEQLPRARERLHDLTAHL